MKKVAELTDQELLHRIKQIKTNKMIDAFIIGITIGIVIYGIVRNGFEFFTFFPLIVGYTIARNSKNNKILEEELQTELASRNSR